MTTDQLQNARLRLFRQDGRALLTADDAGAWLREAGLALFAPRAREIPAPAPTLAEAVAGKADPVPGPAALAEAMRLLVRLQAAGDAVPLLLLNGAGGLANTGDRPDYLATGETLPFVYALRGDREWARGPRGKSSPLTVEVWKLLGEPGSAALTAGEIKDKLGRQLTETAALRALGELWAALRVEPVYAEGADTRWQRMERNRGAAMEAGAATGQATALSALVSLYLQAAIAVSGEEVEAWLGPLQSRSRVRETLRGLVATRQVGVRALAGGEQFYVEGSLPEFADGAEPGRRAPLEMPELPRQAETRVGADLERVLKPVMKPVMKQSPEHAAELTRGDEQEDVPERLSEEVVIEGEAGRYRIEAVPESEQAREAARAASTMGEGRKRFVAGRKGADARSGSGRPGNGQFGSGQAGDRRGAGGGAPGTKKPFFARQPWREDRPGSPGSRASSGGERKSFGPRGGEGSTQPNGPESSRDRERRPFGAGRSFGKEGEGPREERPFEAAKPGFGGKPARPPYGSKPFGAKPFGAKQSSAGKGFGEKRTGPPFGQDRPPRKEFGGAGQRGGFAGTGDGERKPFARREEAPSGERKPFAPREGKPSRPAGGAGQGFGGAARKPFGAAGGGFGGAARKADGGGQGFAGPKRAGGAGTERGQGFEKRGQERPARPLGAEKRFSPREGDAPQTGERSFSGGAQPFRAGGAAPSGARPFGGARPFRKEGGAAPPRRTGASTGRFAPGAGGNAEGDFRAGADADRKAGPKPAGSGFRAGAARPGGKKQRTAPFTSTGKPRAGAAKPGRPGPKADRSKAGGPKPGRPGAGPRKPFGKAPKRDG